MQANFDVLWKNPETNGRTMYVIGCTFILSHDEKEKCKSQPNQTLKEKSNRINKESMQSNRYVTRSGQWDRMQKQIVLIYCCKLKKK